MQIQNTFYAIITVLKVTKNEEQKLYNIKNAVIEIVESGAASDFDIDRQIEFILLKTKKVRNY